MSRLTIGALARRTGLCVRTVRFYADEGIVPEADRTGAGHRVFDGDAVARLRLVRTLRELGIGLEQIRRVLAAEADLADVAASHAAAIDAQIRTLRLHRAVLGVVSRHTDPKELERMTDLATLTAEERRRILDDYLDHVFGGRRDPVAEKLALGAPDLPDDPSPEQVEAWVELARLLGDPGFRAASKAMADRAASDPPPGEDAGAAGMAIGREASAALAASIDPASPEALAVVVRVEALGPPEDRRAAAERIEAFTDRRVGRYWQLVGIVNGRPAGPDPIPAYEWLAAALRAHAEG